jgi:hypothetical protein
LLIRFIVGVASSSFDSAVPAAIAVGQVLLAHVSTGNLAGCTTNRLAPVLRGPAGFELAGLQ